MLRRDTGRRRQRLSELKNFHEVRDYVDVQDVCDKDDVSNYHINDFNVHERHGVFTTRHCKDVLDNYDVHVHKGCPAKVGKPIRIYFGINVRYLIKFFTDLDIRIFGMLTFVSVSMSISIFMSVSSSSS
jgi:hypothetical protein